MTKTVGASKKEPQWGRGVKRSKTEQWVSGIFGLLGFGVLLFWLLPTACARLMPPPLTDEQHAGIVRQMCVQEARAHVKADNDAHSDAVLAVASEKFIVDCLKRNGYKGSR